MPNRCNVRHQIGSDPGRKRKNRRGEDWARTEVGREDQYTRPQLQCIGSTQRVKHEETADQARLLFAKEVPIVDLQSSDRSPAMLPKHRPRSDDICYIVYTSGSSGIPKGVYRDHRSLMHDVLQFTNTIHLNSDDRVALVFSYYFGDGYAKNDALIDFRRPLLAYRA
jgi:acyl-CoA synthetase (AMP-forming)/AMP-acid ligase II